MGSLQYVVYRFVGTNVIIEYELFIVCSPSFGLRVYGLFQCMLWKTNLRGVGEVFWGCPNIVNWQNSSEKHNENHVKPSQGIAKWRCKMCKNEHLILITDTKGEFSICVLFSPSSLLIEHVTTVLNMSCCPHSYNSCTELLHRILHS